MLFYATEFPFFPIFPDVVAGENLPVHSDVNSVRQKLHRSDGSAEIKKRVGTAE